MIRSKREPKIAKNPAPKSPVSFKFAGLIEPAFSTAYPFFTDDHIRSSILPPHPTEDERNGPPQPAVAALVARLKSAGRLKPKQIVGSSWRPCANFWSSASAC